MWKAPSLECGDALADECGAAVDEARGFGAVLESLPGDGVVVGLVGLAEVGGVGEGKCALLLHPVERGRGVEAAGEGNADLFTDGKGIQG